MICVFYSKEEPHAWYSLPSLCLRVQFSWRPYESGSVVLLFYSEGKGLTRLIIIFSLSVEFSFKTTTYQVSSGQQISESCKINCRKSIYLFDLTIETNYQNDRTYFAKLPSCPFIVITDSLRASSPIWASETSLARTRGPSLEHSREARFACPNRRACSQAKLLRAR